MTPERHQQVKRLFLAAVDLAPDKIDSLLDHECKDDGDLQKEVRSLINYHHTETLLGGTPSANAVAGFAAPLPFQKAEHQRTSSTSHASRPAGTIIADRYRLIAPLGRGGMGVVYRAEDLELDQAIALKFLRPELQEQPQALDLVRREVRIARQVTHPNIVRIFDVGTASGETFISMEFVSGEDLESLVRRMGKLPADKVAQIARQLASGLAAAHDAGILHRDLKPANVMIDGAGDAKILDFGIAAPLDDEQALRRVSGTPGYIAPELLRGEKPSPQSDLYGWGAVIYFAATGHMPSNASTERNSSDFLREAGISGEISECIAACLQADPALRPTSAQDLILAIAGGDPLDESIRAGRMPPADILAAASAWQPSPRLLNALLAIGFSLLGLIWLLADQTLFLPRCGLIKSPVVLSEIAANLLDAQFPRATDESTMTGVSLDTDCLRYVRDHPEIANGWHRIAAGELPAVTFWYRRGDVRLPKPGLLTEDLTDSRDVQPGSALVRLNGRGKLLSLQIAPQSFRGKTSNESIVWRRIFEAAGLEWDKFHAVEAGQTPPMYSDTPYEWKGPVAADGKYYVTVLAASLDGRVTSFDVVQPWERTAANAVGLETNQQASTYYTVRAAVWLVAIFLAALMAWRNSKRGYADWRRAWRVTACVFVLGGLNWLCGSRHTLVLSQELAAALDWLELIVFSGAVAGLAYLAVEPPARRWWPWSLITLSRLLDGRFRDIRIAADGLLGIVAGLGCVLLRQLCTLANHALNIPVSGLNDFDPGQNLLDHFGLRYKFAIVITALALAVLQSLLVLTLVVGLQRLIRSTLVSALVLIFVLAALAVFSRGILSPIDWLARTLLLAAATWLLLRYGLLATIMALTTYYAVNNSPLTLDWNRWYFLTGLVVAVSMGTAMAICWRLAKQRLPRFARSIPA